MSKGKTSTGIDTFIDLMKEKKDLSMEEAANHLQVSEDTIQKWVDFLMEEGILITHYKFMKPFITYLDEGGRISSATERKVITQIRSYERKFGSAIKTKDIESAKDILKKIDTNLQKVETEGVKEDIEQDIIGYQKKLEDIEGGNVDLSLGKDTSTQQQRKVEKGKYVSLIQEIKQLSKSGNLDQAESKLVEMKHEMERDPLSRRSRKKLETIADKIAHNLTAIRNMQKEKGESA